jgi:hypothetical protein
MWRADNTVADEASALLQCPANGARLRAVDAADGQRHAGMGNCALPGSHVVPAHHGTFDLQ